MIKTWRLVAVCAVLVLAGGCQKMYYGTWEKLGWHKRDILVDRVKEARDDQQVAKEQFKTTLENFIAVTKADPGDMLLRYNKLQADYTRCEAKANAVRKQIDSVNAVAGALLTEWEQELGQYTSRDLRRASEQEMFRTRDRCRELIAAMRRSEQKMQPVLAAFKDQVLFLKHNLNARAIASLQGTTAKIDADVTALIRDMEASIAEANAFIADMKEK